MPTTVKLRTFTGEPLTVKESMMAQVRYGDKEVKLSPLLLTNDGPSLLGWDWQQINKLHSEALQQVLQKHKNVFKDRLGTLEGYKAKIHIIPGVSCQFCKARSLPYSLIALVEKELNGMCAILQKLFGM